MPSASRSRPARAGWPAALAVMGLLVAVLAGPGSAAGYPKPASAPYRWELRFEPGPLRLFVDSEDGRAYWYFTYTVTNRTDDTRLWAPKIVLYTDRGAILPSGESVPLRVRRTLMALLRNPLLEDRNEIIGDLRPGREFARDGLVAWAAEDMQVSELSLFVGGISGETARITPPGSTESVILQKTLRLDYFVPGNILARAGEDFEPVGREWIFR